MARHSPNHPGEVLKTEYLDELGITPYALSRDAGIDKGNLITEPSKRDHISDGLPIAMQHDPQIFWIQAVGQTGRTDHVAEHDRELPALNGEVSELCFARHRPLPAYLEIVSRCRNPAHGPCIRSEIRRQDRPFRTARGTP